LVGLAAHPDRPGALKFASTPWHRRKTDIELFAIGFWIWANQEAGVASH
jgi:hypothetical protein